MTFELRLGAALGTLPCVVEAPQLFYGHTQDFSHRWDHGGRDRRRLTLIEGDGALWESLSCLWVRGSNYPFLTVKERDNETNLDYFLARYYGSTQGRFTSPDPLYIEMMRLRDPQQLNLYSYTRDNPLKFIDPSGLDIAVKGNAQDDYMTRLQQRTPSFKVALQGGKVTIVNDKGEAVNKKGLKDLGKTLSGGEKELFKAITDTDNHVTINTLSKADPNVDFGRFDGKGTNTLDFADINQLSDDANSPFSASQVVGHETLEAYEAAKTGATLSGDPHDYANQFFGGLELPVGGVLRIVNNTIPDISVDLPIHNNPQFRLRLTREFLTPIPINAIPTGHTPAHIKNPQVLNNCGPEKDANSDVAQKEED